MATDLDTFGGSYSEALGINASGQVVGYAYLPGNSAYHAFLVTPVDSDNDGTPNIWYQDADLNGINDLMRTWAPSPARIARPTGSTTAARSAPNPIGDQA